MVHSELSFSLSRKAVAVNVIGKTVTKCTSLKQHRTTSKIFALSVFNPTTSNWLVSIAGSGSKKIGAKLMDLSGNSETEQEQLGNENTFGWTDTWLSSHVCHPALALVYFLVTLNTSGYPLIVLTAERSRTCQ
jgi:hypothetical protein